MDLKELFDTFEQIEVIKEYDGYHYKGNDALKVVVPGSLCGLKNISQIHQWATSEHVKTFLEKAFGIKKVPYLLLASMLIKTGNP